MRPNSYHAWQHAEHRAREAALALQAELAKPGHIPRDAIFVELRLSRRRASQALYELTLYHADQSARVSAARE